MCWHVYILRSLKDGMLYTGYTRNVEKRLDRHNRGLTKSTRCRRPFELVYVERYPTKSAAIKREIYLKSLEGSLEKRELVSKFYGGRSSAG
ncbi:MAG: GIY-YIG nuclease family protein [Planctomycetota bacterium]